MSGDRARLSRILGRRMWVEDVDIARTVKRWEVVNNNNDLHKSDSNNNAVSDLLYVSEPMLDGGQGKRNAGSSDSEWVPTERDEGIWVVDVNRHATCYVHRQDRTATWQGDTACMRGTTADDRQGNTAASRRETFTTTGQEEASL